MSNIVCPSCHDLLWIRGEHKTTAAVCRTCDVQFIADAKMIRGAWRENLKPVRMSDGADLESWPNFLMCDGCSSFTHIGTMAYCTECHEPWACVHCAIIADNTGVYFDDSNICNGCRRVILDQSLEEPLLARIAELEAQIAQQPIHAVMNNAGVVTLDDRILNLIGVDVWHVDDIVRELNMPIVDISAALGMMEIFGKVKNLGGMNIQSAQAHEKAVA